MNNEEVEENTHAAHRNSPHRGMADDLPVNPGMTTSGTTTHDAVSNDSATESPVTSQAESSQQARTPVPAVLPTKPKPGSSDAPIVIEDTPPFRPTRPMTPVSPMAFNTHLPTFGIDALTPTLRHLLPRVPSRNTTGWVTTNMEVMPTQVPVLLPTCPSPRCLHGTI